MTSVFILTQLQYSEDFDVEINHKVFNTFDKAVAELKADVETLINERDAIIDKDYNNAIDKEEEYATYKLSNNYTSYQLDVEKYYLKDGEINGD